LSCNCNNFNNFVTLVSTSFRLPEDDAAAFQHVGVLTNIIYIYMCSEFVGMDNKQIQKVSGGHF